MSHEDQIKQMVYNATRLEQHARELEEARKESPSPAAQLCIHSLRLMTCHLCWQSFRG